MFARIPRRMLRRVLLSVAAALPLVALAGPPTMAGSGLATITILHGLPKVTADVYVNGKLTLDGFEPESATGALSLPAGDYDVAIREVGSSPTSDPALEATITLKAGKNYSAIAHLDGTGEPALSLFENDMSKVPAGKARLVVRNQSTSPPLDLRLGGKAAFKHVAPDSEAAKNLAPGSYTVDAVDSSDGSRLVSRTAIDLTEGTETIVYVVGSAQDQALDFMVQDIADLGSDPGGIFSGSGGLAAPAGFPLWASGLVLLCAALAAGSAVALRKGR